MREIWHLGYPTPASGLPIGAGGEVGCRYFESRLSARAIVHVLEEGIKTQSERRKARKAASVS